MKRCNILFSLFLSFPWLIDPFRLYCNWCAKKWVCKCIYSFEQLRKCVHLSKCSIICKKDKFRSAKCDVRNVLAWLKRSICSRIYHRPLMLIPRSSNAETLSFKWQKRLRLRMKWDLKREQVDNQSSPNDETNILPPFSTSKKPQIIDMNMTGKWTEERNCRNSTR